MDYALLDNCLQLGQQVQRVELNDATYIPVGMDGCIISQPEPGLDYGLFTSCWPDMKTLAHQIYSSETGMKLGETSGFLAKSTKRLHRIGKRASVPLRLISTQWTVAESEHQNAAKLHEGPECSRAVAVFLDGRSQLASVPAAIQAALTTETGRADPQSLDVSAVSATMAPGSFATIWQRAAMFGVTQTAALECSQKDFNMTTVTRTKQTSQSFTLGLGQSPAEPRPLALHLGGMSYTGSMMESIAQPYLPYHLVLPQRGTFSYLCPEP
eukprot:scaffold405609_cov56-Prasinocladus_malaysianus.AAC.1